MTTQQKPEPSLAVKLLVWGFIILIVLLTVRAIFWPATEAGLKQAQDALVFQALRDAGYTERNGYWKLDCAWDLPPHQALCPEAPRN